MKFDLKTKIHNEFLIEVRNIETNEIKKGHAYNIMLDSLLTFNLGGYIWNSHILYGDGTGSLLASRTTLFNRKGAKTAEIVGGDYGQANGVSYITKKIVLGPSEEVGLTIKEVGLGSNTTIPHTHALIKDSEGNDLVLGPKTNIQEITIYATVYFQPNFENGITLLHPSKGYSGIPDNAILRAFLGWGASGLSISGGYGAKVFINNTGIGYLDNVLFNEKTSGKLSTPDLQLGTPLGNGKIKNIQISSSLSPYNIYPSSLNIDLETLADNESTLWSGHSFLNKNIGVGDGVTKVFNLPWDEAVLTKTKKVYVNGVEKTSGVTWATGKITFDDAPLDALNITGDWFVKYIPKDTDHIVNIKLSILYNEGTPI